MNNSNICRLRFNTWQNHRNTLHRNCVMSALSIRRLKRSAFTEGSDVLRNIDEKSPWNQIQLKWSYVERVLVKKLRLGTHIVKATDRKWAVIPAYLSPNEATRILGNVGNLQQRQRNHISENSMHQTRCLVYREEDTHHFGLWGLFSLSAYWLEPLGWTKHCCSPTEDVCFKNKYENARTYG